MSNRPSINLDRINEGESITITKTYDGTGKECRNGNVMYGVLHEGTEKNLFVHQGTDTMEILEKLNTMKVNTSVKLSSNRGGGYSIDGAVVKKTEFKPVNEKSDEIKWGMAFNNATRLVMSEHEFDGDVMKRVELIEKIMPKMYEIAKGMPQPKQNEDELF